MRTNIALSCLTVMLAFGAFPLYAGQAPDPRIAEAQVAAQEEKELQAQGKVPDRGHESVLRGTFLTLPPGGGNTRTDIIGQFQVTGYSYAFQVKVMDPSGVDAFAVTKLTAFNGQAVTLGGKIRNKSDTYPQGQYFILGEVLTQTGGAVLPTKTNTAPGRL